MSPDVASRLVDVPETEMPSLGLYLVDSADPANSVILTKVQASTVPYGAQMPSGRAPLSAQQVACLAAWINSVVADAGTGSSSSSGASQAATSSGQSSTTSVVSSTSTSAGSSQIAASSSAHTGTGSSSGSGSVSTAISFKTVYSTVIQGSCTSHHSGTNPSGGLDMSTEAKAFTNLTTGTSSATAEVGCNEHYVVSANAAKSLLYEKVVGPPTLPTACGVQMPKGEAALSSTDVALIEDWINDGAAP